MVTQLYSIESVSKRKKKIMEYYNFRLSLVFQKTHSNLCHFEEIFILIKNRTLKFHALVVKKKILQCEVLVNTLNLHYNN